ncbi:MAG TPA: uroporphyrinogen-III synthase [Candidatus Baltobacteraceae bacterium]|nr:uroporphyrinogen-III synthase [Candidatus Baltobacteraceae bacterium]
MTEQTRPTGLTGLRVLALESRRAGEMAKLIAAYGGKGTVAPSMREVPLESNTEAIAFARTLASGGFDMAIFLTGVGTRALARVVETMYPIEKFAEALRAIAIVARGPKPVAALKELGVPVRLAVPEPNTWRDLLRALDENVESLPLAGRRVAVQEYGVSNPELLAGLAERGAKVTRVPVYQWALPEDTGPLRAAVRAIVDGQVDVAVFTTSVQIVHLLQIARELNLERQLREGLARIVVGSIGPVTSEELREQGVTPDFEPVHPKMGFLLNEAGQRGKALLEEKRRSASG